MLDSPHQEPQGSSDDSDLSYGTGSGSGTGTSSLYSSAPQSSDGLSSTLNGPNTISNTTIPSEFQDEDDDDDTFFTSDNYEAGASVSGLHHVDHSLPNPDTLPRTKVQKGSKTMQTIAGVAGNILEWYDFAVFGYFSDVLGEVFFPPQEGHAAIIESFAVFGLAFLCRPIGGVMLGYIGDVYGRKRALELSIFLMAFPTFAMGCLPSYAQVGPLAIVLLTLVRMLQGLSVGGQLVSSLVFTLENNPRSQWGLYGSYVMAAANFGTLLGGVVSFSMRAALDEEQLKIWGWRIPFLSGILVSLCGLYLKFYCDDDGVEGHHPHGGADDAPPVNPIKAAFSRNNLRALLAASLVPMLWSGGFYITFVWMATFMGILVDPPVPGAFGINSVALFLSVCILFPLAGILSDMFGRAKVMYVGGIAMGLLSPLMVIIISTGDPIAAFFAQSAMGIALSLWGAPMCAWLVESFPASMRLTSVAVGYNMAQAIVGGSAPALATYLVDKYGVHAPGFMVSAIAISAVTGLCIAPPLIDDEDVNSTEPESLVTSKELGGDLSFTYRDDEEDDAPQTELT